MHSEPHYYVPWARKRGISVDLVFQLIEQKL
jgi:hypothetical protein